MVATLFSSVETAESKRPLPSGFGTDVAINIFPTSVVTDEWSGLEQVLIQDLSENALYQDFSARNAAYVPRETPEPVETPSQSVSAPTPSSLPASTASSSVEDPVAAEVISTTTLPDATQPSEPSVEDFVGEDQQVVDEFESVTVPEEPAVESETPTPTTPSPSPSQDDLADPLQETAYLQSLPTFSGVFPLTTKLFPLLVGSSTTPIELAPDVVVADVPAEELLEVTQTSDVGEVLDESIPAAMAPEQEFNQEDSLSPILEPAALTELAATTSTESAESNSTPEAQAAVLQSQTNPLPDSEPNEQQKNLSVHELTLADFGKVLLEPGQFITGAQLRVSMGAKLKQPVSEGSAPFIEILYGSSTDKQVVGIVLLEDEISNALNGGYFLFALPDVADAGAFANKEVTIRYNGAKDDLDGMFFDAAWLELQTTVVTEDDIQKRGAMSNFKHLQAPEIATLMSSKVNFTQSETPLFNLKYKPQRNALIRGVRSLFGSDMVAVSEVDFQHVTYGSIGVKPEVTVTRDGLVTIEIPDEQRKMLRPGEYTVEVSFDEGGVEVVDTFNFQWGLLTINPNKSEYSLNEPVQISIGALTPTGHTICQADLNLYVTDPIGGVQLLEVVESGKCNGNNVIDVPDFSAQTIALDPGEHTMYLERLGENGEILSFTTDTFLVSADQRLSIERTGPTRIYPPATYPMELLVDAVDGFKGTLTERVPLDFIVTDTTADITLTNQWQLLTWEVDIARGQTETVSYDFDAPDVSPYLYTVGPAELRADVVREAPVDSIASTTQQAAPDVSYFAEHRQWQIASDAVGRMLLFWDDDTSIPAGWTCVSCAPTDPFFNRFIMGSSTGSTTGGVATHTHTAITSFISVTGTSVIESGTAGPASIGHDHTLTPTISAASNLPEYRELRVIQTIAPGAPATIPAGAIAIFDVASSSLPANWNRYSAQDGRYIRSASTTGTLGGSNTHAHTVTGTLGASVGTARSRGGGTQETGSADAHTHTISTTTETVNNEPPYIEVVLAQASVDVPLTNGIIAMWSEDVDDGWLDVSSESGDPFNQRFLKPATAYNSSGGGARSHTNADILGAETSGPSGVPVSGRAGSSAASTDHTHIIDFTDFSEEENLPPYITVVFGKRQGTDPVYEQFSSQWFVNTNTATPTDAWPDDSVQALDLAEREPITSASTPLKVGDEVRLRINSLVSNATSTPGAQFKLQFAATDTCSSGVWFDVGGAASTTVWRGYDNSSVADNLILGSTLLSSSTVVATYQENGIATGTPNQALVDDYLEWDFVLQQNGAEAGTNYCFRMVEIDGTTFGSYSHYPQLFTNQAPDAPTLQKLFDNEKITSTAPEFFFVALDAEGQTIDYEIEIDNNSDFSSPVISENTLSDPTNQFINQVLESAKPAFESGELIRFIGDTVLTPTTTYYWRVRGQDPEGSQQWGDWSDVRSFTIDTTLEASAWYQEEGAQFSTNSLSGVEVSGDSVGLIAAAPGTMTSTPIDFAAGELGTAWASIVIDESDSSSVLDYQVEFLDATDTWTLIPDSDLPGNSAGLTVTTIDLLSLDIGIYSTIRLVADFTATTGTPTLNSWTVNWGYLVETPTIISPFPSEQIGTTTPTFRFETSDPQNNNLTYQVQWSETPDFAASTTRTSDAAAVDEFVNLDDGVDQDPFTSGETIAFTVQPGNSLTASTTYWLRVRAKDTDGSDAYSFWTEPQSFTVIPGTEVSTWFQTTQDQFSSNILSGTVAISPNDLTVATTATEAIVVYGEGTQDIPRYRIWDGSTMSAEESMLDVGAPLKWAVVKAATTREEYVAATVGSDGDVNAQVFATGAWDNLQEMTLDVGSVNARGMDVAYETFSGDAMVVYCNGAPNPSYRIWDGSSWSAEGTITLATANDCEWVQLASDPTSNEIIMMSRETTGGAYEAQVWNATTSTWGNSTTFGSIVDSGHEGMSLEYEASGGQAVAMSSDGNPARFRWRSWDGTTWSGAATFTIGDDFEWGQLVRDVGSDQMAMCYSDEDQDVGMVRWTGAAWAGQVELSVDGNVKNDPVFACVFENTPSRDAYILTTLSNTTQTEYYTWNTTAWSGATQVDTFGTSNTMRLERTGDATILGAFFDTLDRLRFTTWDGTTWSAVQNLETDMSVDTAPYGQPYDMAARKPGSDGTTIVSPPINFSDGTGPYWESFSWNDTQDPAYPILYSLQYQTATGSWAFIPDTDLPGNTAGTTTGPFDLSELNISTYSTLRPYATLSCSGAGTCPSLQDWKIEWAGGITVSGTAFDYARTASTTGLSLRVAVNGVEQIGKTGSVLNGDWTIDNVTAFPGDIITVFVDTVSDANEAVAVTRYDGFGDVDGMILFERHLSLGSNDATSTPITNLDIGLYDRTNNSQVFVNETGGALTLCDDIGCSEASLYVQAGTIYEPGGGIVTHDFINDGSFTPGAITVEVSGSWDNNATTTMTGSTVVFAATSTTELIDSTDAVVDSFGDVVFGTTTGSGVWNLTTPLDVDGDMTVSRGTLARGTTSIEVAGDLTTTINGFWTGLATTTFDGSGGSTWSDLNSVLQNPGYVVVDGTAKVVTLGDSVAAQSIFIGVNDTLDASASNHALTVYGDWENQNTFIAREGDVQFVATTTGVTITTSGDAFYDLSFTGAGGAWSFTESTLLVSNDFTIATGTVTLPTATTTISGSFDATGGTFANNNGVLEFDSNTPETIIFDGGQFTNVTHTVLFNGAGTWTMLDVNATTTSDVLVQLGTVTFPSGVYAIGGTLSDTGGTFDGGTGTVAFYSSATEVITSGGSSYNNVTYNGTGDWSFSDTDVDINGDLSVFSGALTLPAGTLSIGGSYNNNAVVTAGTGAVLFDSADTGESVDFGASSLHNVTFDNLTGGWTVVAAATTTGTFSLANAGDWTLSAGQLLSVGDVFTNSVGRASTTWDIGSTLSLESGSYSINTKSDIGDDYAVLRISSAADVAMWNSSAATYAVDPAGSLYSQDHDNINGDLYIFGEYEKTGGNEYWSYATDFDGTDLATTSSERSVQVRFADGATATFASTTVEVLGDVGATTTIANQGTGSYEVLISAGTTTAQYYDFADLGSTGLSLVDGVIVETLRDGSYEVAVNSGTALTLSSTTIDANPGKQVFNVTFATTTAISATNVIQSDGVPASFWWFRQGLGNLYGESFDADDGDPGSVRFDDSSLVITLSGVVYDDTTVTPLGSGTCDGTTQVVRVVVDGGVSYAGSCSAATGAYSIPGVVVIGDPTLTVYLDNAAEFASVITRTPTADITDLDLYENRVIVRNEDVEALSIANLAVYDNSNDSDLQFIAATTTTPDTLTVLAGNEFFVNASSTFTAGGEVTLAANAAANSYDGTLYVDDAATFNAFSTSTLTIGGRFVLGASSTFAAASTTVIMNASTTGKSVTASDEITFNELQFTGSGGAWNIGADIVVLGDMAINAGTVTGTGDIMLPSGSITGNGFLSLGAGTTTIAASNTLGGATDWTFFNLQLGDTTQVGTTTPAFSGTTTVAGRLTIATAHFLDANNSNWNLNGTGVVFVENGTFLEDTSTVRYSGGNSDVAAVQYYNLDINSLGGTATYTPAAAGIIVDNDLTIGGTATSILDISTNNVLFDVNGDVVIRSNGTLTQSAVADFTIAGSYDNNGVLNGNGGTLLFDGSGMTTIAAGTSEFASVVIDGAADVTVTEHATATGAWTLTDVNSFTVTSGQSLAVGGTFFTALPDSDTVWTGATLRLFGGLNYSINATSTGDSYDNLEVTGTTQIRVWNTDALTYGVDASASLYSQDHAGVDGDLYIFGDYQNNSLADYWSYATDFDGSSLAGVERKADIYFAASASATYTGGSLTILGTSSASTTVQHQGVGTYSLAIGGVASTSMQYYEIRDIDSQGLVFTGTPTVVDISNGDLEVSQNTGSAITVGGGAIDVNPAKTFTLNRFALNGVAGGFNVTATGSSVSSWRFTNHYGDIDGEVNDVDPDGDPGYIVWDDSAASITISGTVYSDQGSTVAGVSVCDGSTTAVRVVVAGLTTYDSSCTNGGGVYSVSGVTYSPGDSIIAYLLVGTGEEAAAVTVDPISNINNFDLYFDRVILRHENTEPITIDDLAVYDSSDDSNIPFTAVSAGTDTLTLPADRKLIVWDGKTFAPAGDVTIASGGVETYGGSVQLLTGAGWTGSGAESLSIGGNFVLDAGATFAAAGTGTTTFTSVDPGKTIDVNESVFANVAFTGTGAWTISDVNTTINGNFNKTGGTLTLSSGTTTVAGSFNQTGGTFDANDGLLFLTGSGTRVVELGGSDAATLLVAGGDYSFVDTAATTTGSTTVSSGSLTLPSSSFVVGGDFSNVGGTIAHNTSELIMTNVTAATVLASSSDLFSVTFTGGGAYAFEDESLTLLGDLFIDDGSVQMASGTLAVGGSFDATGGTFDNATGTILFNSADTGEFIEPGVSEFYNVQISAPTGGYTLTSNATTSNNFAILSADTFIAQPSTTLVVEGVFLNLVGGAATTWTGSTLVLDGSNAYSVNTKLVGGDIYNNLIVGANSDIRFWDSSATTTVDQTSSVYSQDDAGVAGALAIYGDFHISTTTEYWSYATDFDGASLSGSERQVVVSVAENATTTVDGGALEIVGVEANRTTVSNQGSGTYALSVGSGTFGATYYAFTDLNQTGLNLSGTPTITDLSYGDYELAVNGGSLITLASSTLNANASLVILGNSFATTTAITGTNVELVGVNANAWTFTGHSGNLDGEEYDEDGVSACGSIRWDDSSCLLTQQTDYRWRNDDGGLGVPDTEWYDPSWLARKQVRIDNADATTYTEAAVRLFVDFDADMQFDFKDLRFTADDGLTEIPFWVGSTTASTLAEVWVRLSTLPADSVSTVYMYYDNVSATTTTSSSTAVFTVADDFEDNDIAEYSGETTKFTTGATFAYDGSVGLDNPNNLDRASAGGIYPTVEQTVSQGETFRFMQYIDAAGTNDEVCTKFGIQGTNVPNDNYAVCVEFPGVDRISIVKDVVENEGSGTVLGSTTATFSTGWYEFEVDWATDGSLDLTVFDAPLSEFATVSASDSSYTSGNFGFTFWFNRGGWDSVSSRPTLTTEPTYVFGSEQVDGGASWKAAQNTVATFLTNDAARLRVGIENTGLGITNQQFRLEYAEKGTAPSCEAVNPLDFVAVPVQASCGLSPVCMQSTTQYVNAAATADLLTNMSGVFTAGAAVEDPVNTTGSIDVAQNEYTEIEYTITPTVNVTDQNLCFRVTDSGSTFDTYLQVPELSLRFDPVLTNVTLNDGFDISLTPGTTTIITASSTVSDFNGVSDLAAATTTFYTTAATAACTPNNNNCYIATSTCSYENCSGSTCSLQCTAPFAFHADATDTDGAQEWFAFMEVSDQSGASDFGTSVGVDLFTLRALTVQNAIAYGSVETNNDTGAFNPQVNILNIGNEPIDVQIAGTDMADGFGSTIVSTQQLFSTSTFTYATCLTCTALTNAGTAVDLDLAKPLVSSPSVNDQVYWGIEVPIGTASAAHTGINFFTAIAEIP